MISPKNYSSVFRNLYLASYLDENSSNEVLNILTQTEFKDGLDKYLPTDVKVAHKIGDFQTDTENIHHDCGIVYVPKRPYMLCLMVQSEKDTTAGMKDYIGKVSALVYQYISNVNSVD